MEDNKELTANAANVLQDETVIDPGIEQPEIKEEKKSEPLIASAFFEATSVLVMSMVIITFIFTFLFRLVGVSGSSMQDTLEDGDWLIVTPYYTEPAYGDIVISTKDTAADGSLVKRVIAVAGDEVVVDEYDNVFVNGVEIDDDSFIRTDGQNYRHGNLEYPVTVPEGCVMLMGDHRSVSWDSRFSEIGFAETDYLLGKARLRLSSDWNIYSNFPED